MQSKQEIDLKSYFKFDFQRFPFLVILISKLWQSIENVKYLSHEMVIWTLFKFNEIRWLLTLEKKYTVT